MEQGTWNMKQYFPVQSTASALARQAEEINPQNTLAFDTSFHAVVDSDM